MDSDDEAWDGFGRDIDAVRTSVAKTTAMRVAASGPKEATKGLVQSYFRRVRPSLVSVGLTEADLSELDASMQQLLAAANSKVDRAYYLKRLGEAKRGRQELAFRREMLLGVATTSTPIVGLSAIETQIVATLGGLVPTAERSYSQALADLADGNRLSFRGTANELRSVLWDVLDRLAPDEDVATAPGFKFEKDAKKPTQKQKARHILKSRNVTENARRAPEGSVDLIEGLVASIARSTYDRSSISTHVATTRAEVMQIKGYLDSVLADLLAIHHR